MRPHRHGRHGPLPLPPAMKRREEGRWDLAWGGIASLGLALPVLWTALIAAASASESKSSPNGWPPHPRNSPASLDAKGSAHRGADADFVVFDPVAAWTVTPTICTFATNFRPTWARELRGRVLETWLRGEPIFQSQATSSTTRAAESWCAHDEDRAAACHRRMQTNCRHDRRAWPHHAPISHAARCTTCTPILRARMEALGMTVHVDAAGNLRGLWQPAAASGKRLMMGSHIDTVPECRRIRRGAGRDAGSRMGRALRRSSSCRWPSK